MSGTSGTSITNAPTGASTAVNTTPTTPTVIGVGFDEVDFPSNILSYGSTSSFEFATDVISVDSGFERRNIKWTTGRHSYEANTDNQNARTIGVLVAFFNARFGRAKGFRLRDPFDNSTANSPLDVAGNTANTAQPFGTGDGVRTVWQLVKVYGLGPYYVRPIVKPTAGSVNVYSNNQNVPGQPVASSGYTVDFTTGLITFAAAPSAGSHLWWSGNFSVPVRFDLDKLSIDYVDGEIMDSKFPIVELRYPITVALYDPALGL